MSEAPPNPRTGRMTMADCYCQEKRYGMYNPRAVCGEYATHIANGSPVCAVHAQRSLMEGKTVVPRDRFPSHETLKRQIASDPDDDPSVP